MTAIANQSGAKEWRNGWKVVLASSLGFSFFSVLISSAGLFMGPLGDEFGWSRTMLSSGPSIATLAIAFLGPFFGMLVDRYGTRRLTLPGLALTMAAMSGFALLDGSMALWIGLWLFFGTVAVSIKSTAWTAAVVGIFTTSRGLALAVTLGGTALTQTLVPPLGNWLITEFGWRAAYVYLALGWGGVTLLLCYLFFYDINDQVRDRKSRASAKDDTATRELSGLSLHQAVRDSALQRVAISNFIVMALTMGLSVHLFPILTDAGVSRSAAAWLAALGGLAGIGGKLVTGVLLDRFRPNWIGGITLGIAALVFLLLLDGVRNYTFIVIAMIVNGYAAGTKTQITAFLTAGYSGMKNFGAIYGFMSALMAFGVGIGPLIAGLIYDYMGGYGPFLIIGTIGCVIGGLIVLSLPAYPIFEEQADDRLSDPSRVGLSENGSEARNAT